MADTNPLLQKLFNGWAFVARSMLNRQARRAFRQKGYHRLWDRRPRDAKPPIWADLWFLYMATTYLKPKVVLEFGSGCSTYAIAQALADNARLGQPGHLYSLDADPKWGRVTQEAMPAHLAELVTLTITEAVPCEYEGVPVWRFAQVPDVEPDIVYLDGPALQPGRTAAVDVLDMQDKLPVGCRVIVDGRKKNVLLLDQHWRREVAKRPNRILQNTVYEIKA